MDLVLLQWSEVQPATGQEGEGVVAKDVSHHLSFGKPPDGLGRNGFGRVRTSDPMPRSAYHHWMPLARMRISLKHTKAHSVPRKPVVYQYAALPTSLWYRRPLIIR